MNPAAAAAPPKFFLHKHPTLSTAVLIRCEADGNPLMGRFGFLMLDPGLRGYVCPGDFLEHPWLHEVQRAGGEVVDLRHAHDTPSPPLFEPRPPPDVARQRDIDGRGRQLVRDLTAVYVGALEAFAAGDAGAALTGLVFVQCWCKHDRHALEVRGVDRDGRPWPHLTTCEPAPSPDDGCPCPVYPTTPTSEES